jgi:hypothetical protein
MSLGMSIALSLCSIFGALVPPIYRELAGVDGDTISHIVGRNGGQVVLLGILVCVFGIFLCGKAGMMKERELSQEQKQETIKEFSLTKGLIVATISGLCSACFNFGIEAGKDMADVAVAKGCDPLFQNNVIFIVVLWGGFLTNFIYCMYLNFSNNSFGDYLNASAPLKNLSNLTTDLLNIQNNGYYWNTTKDNKILYKEDKTNAIRYKTIEGVLNRLESIKKILKDDNISIQIEIEIVKTKKVGRKEYISIENGGIFDLKAYNKELEEYNKIKNNKVILKENKISKEVLIIPSTDSYWND